MNEGFLELPSKFPSYHMDQQHNSMLINKNEEGSADVLAGAPQTTEDAVGSSVLSDEFFDMIAVIQGSRMDDQRATFPEIPGLHTSQIVIDQLLSQQEDNLPDDQFFEMLLRCQGTRIEEQRSSLPPSPQTPTLPDEDQLFSLIQRLQSNRIEDQRSYLPEPLRQQLASSDIKKKKQI